MRSFITYRRVYLSIIFTIGIRSNVNILQSVPLNPNSFNSVISPHSNFFFGNTQNIVKLVSPPISKENLRVLFVSN